MAGTGLGVQAWGSLGLSLRSLLGPLALVFHACPSVLILKVSWVDQQSSIIFELVGNSGPWTLS